MQVHTRMSVEKLPQAAALRTDRLSANGVNFTALGLSGHDAGKERHKGIAGVLRCGFADDLAGLCIQGRIQRERSVPVILETVMLGATRRKRQDGIESVRGLSGGFFVHAESGGVLGRVDMEANDIGCLLLEVRVIRCPVTLHTMGLQTCTFPDSGHPHVMGSQVPRQLATAPVHRSIQWRSPGPVQNSSLPPGGVLLNPSTVMSRIQTGQPLLLESGLPPAHIARISAHGALGLHIRFPGIHPQNDLVRRTSSDRSRRERDRRCSSLLSSEVSLMRVFGVEGAGPNITDHFNVTVS